MIALMGTARGGTGRALRREKELWSVGIVYSIGPRMTRLGRNAEQCMKWGVVVSSQKSVIMATSLEINVLRPDSGASSTEKLFYRVVQHIELYTYMYVALCVYMLIM